jgi:dihydroorotate dehydrogenase electron transfer subunit
LKYLETGAIVYREEIHPGLFLLRYLSPQTARIAMPGQFVHIRVGSGVDPLLRRPFSIQNVIGNEIEILLKVYGRGSDLLSMLRVGDSLDTIGPLGNPWTIPSNATAIVGVSGGVGVAPVLFQQERWKNKSSFFHLIGARTGDELPLTERQMRTSKVEIATDDGSRGYAGTVVELAGKMWLEGTFGDTPYFLTCGPWSMMKALIAWTSQHGFRGQFSAEARMGCAVGVCQGCAVARPLENGSLRQYYLCCKDGPVFDFGTIDMEVSPFGA